MWHVLTGIITALLPCFFIITQVANPTVLLSSYLFVFLYSAFWYSEYKPSVIHYTGQWIQKIFHRNNNYYWRIERRSERVAPTTWKKHIAIFQVKKPLFLCNFLTIFKAAFEVLNWDDGHQFLFVISKIPMLSIFIVFFFTNRASFVGKGGWKINHLLVMQNDAWINCLFQIKHGKPFQCKIERSS